MGIVLRGGECKESATLGTIYHRLQSLGPGSEVKVKAEVRKQQTDLMERVNKGEDLDGQIVRLANLLTSLYHKAEAMAHIFWEKYPQPPHFKTIETEIKHTMVWNGLILEGTIDKLLMAMIGQETTDGVWIRDHKSTGMTLESLFGGLAWSLQGRIYRPLAEDYCHKNPDKLTLPAKYSVAGEYVIRGFILDGILKPGIKLCKTDEKNAKEWGVSIEDAYLRRVKEWYAEKNEDAVRSRAILFTEPLFPAELQEALEVMRDLSSRVFCVPEQFERDVTRQECFAFMKQCIYHDLCSTDPKNWGPLFETKYKMAESEGENEEDTVQDSDAG
jgi:hypothetical protein